MIKWWKKKRRKDVILCSKLLVHIFTCSEFFHFFHDHWFTFSTYHFRATNFFYHRFRQTTRILHLSFNIKTSIQTQQIDWRACELFITRYRENFFIKSSLFDLLFLKFKAFHNSKEEKISLTLIN